MRTQQAEATRASIREAARARFLTHGWAGTTVRDVAAAAAVSEAMVYAVYGSKAGLAGALVEAIDRDAGVLDADAVRAASSTALGQLEVMVAIDRRLFEDNGDVVALMHDAGPSEPELSAAYATGRAQASRIQQSVFASWPRGTLRPGIGPVTAADTYAALCCIGVYEVLTVERGWSADRVERWWVRLLAGMLLSEPERTTAATPSRSGGRRRTGRAGPG